MADVKGILEERAKTHGSFACVAEIAQQLKDSMRDGCNWASPEMSSAQYEALEMFASKIARILCGNPNEVDHWRDIAGYAMLIVRELEEKEREPKDNKAEEA